MKKWMLLLSLVLMIVIVNCGQAQAAEKTPESLRIAARIELEKAQKFNLEAEAARTATDKPV